MLESDANFSALRLVSIAFCSFVLFVSIVSRTFDCVASCFHCCTLFPLCCSLFLMCCVNFDVLRLVSIVLCTNGPQLAMEA